MTWLLIAAGGVLGAPARYVLDRAIGARGRRAGLPRGTIVVNVLGSLLLGSCVAIALHGVLWAFVATGFCGAFTTFSTFTLETLALYEDGMPRHAVANALVSLLLGVGAAALGVTLG